MSNKHRLLKGKRGLYNGLFHITIYDFRLAVLLGIGMWLAKRMSFTKDVRSFLIFVIINIALPAIILNGFFQVAIDNNLMKQIIIIFIFSLFVLIYAFYVRGWAFSRTIGLGALKARETAFLATFKILV